MADPKKLSLMDDAPAKTEAPAKVESAAVLVDSDRVNLNYIVGRGRTVHHGDASGVKAYGPGSVVPYTRAEIKDGTVDRLVKLGFLVPTNMPDRFVSQNGDGPETNIVEEGLSLDGPSARVA